MMGSGPRMAHIRRNPSELVSTNQEGYELDLRLRKILNSYSTDTSKSNLRRIQRNLHELDSLRDLCKDRGMLKEIDGLERRMRVVFDYKFHNRELDGVLGGIEEYIGEHDRDYRRIMNSKQDCESFPKTANFVTKYFDRLSAFCPMLEEHGGLWVDFPSQMKKVLKVKERIDSKLTKICSYINKLYEENFQKVDELELRVRGWYLFKCNEEKDMKELESRRCLLKMIEKIR